MCGDRGLTADEGQEVREDHLRGYVVEDLARVARALELDAYAAHLFVMGVVWGLPATKT